MKTFLLSVFVLLTVTGCVSRTAEEELHIFGKRIEYHLLNTAQSQSEMTTLSQYMLQLAWMEKDLTEFRIWNQPNYEKIEKEFIADCKEWEKKAEVEAARKSEFEGGSMAPCDKNMRMAYFVRKRIQELNAKWRQK